MFTFLRRKVLVTVILFIGITESNVYLGNAPITQEKIRSYKERVSNMFKYGYENYLHYAYPYDELRPISCDGVDTWGQFSLTLIDALDTLAVMGNYSEFRRVTDLITHNINFDINVNVSVFETNIRVVGGLISAHLLSKKAGLALEPGWPCNGPLLRLAEKVAYKVLPAFDTKTGMPYGTVNLRHGVPPGETAITCVAGVATFIVEFGALSRLTGNPIFEDTAMRAINYLWKTRSKIGLIGNHINVQTGVWTAGDSGIGAGVDSYFEYLVKGSILLQKPELMNMFEEHKKVIYKYNRHDDWFLWVGMTHGKISLPIFQSLEAFWPGLLSLVGDLDQASKTMHNYHQVWKQYGFTPEYYDVVQNEVYSKRDAYPLRPELIESAFYLHRATKDPFYLQIGMDIVEAIEHSAKTPCGYATIKDVHTHEIEDRMESFFLAETTKYLYLLFDEDNFITKNINPTLWGDKVSVQDQTCVLNSGAYIFNTEAHPIDISAVHCCSAHHKQNTRDINALNDETDIFQLLINPRKANNVEKSKFSKYTHPHPVHMPSEAEEHSEKDVLEYSEASTSTQDTFNNNDKKDIPVESTDNIIQTVTIPTKPEANSSIDENIGNTQSSNVYSNNTDDFPLKRQFDALMCSAQPFLMRLSVMGQMFYV